MKRILIFLICLLVISIKAEATNGNDSNKYNIINEADYAILLYDIKNSLITQYSQIDSTDAELRASYIIGNLDLLKIKEDIIKQINQENLSILKRNFTYEKVKKLSDIFSQAINTYTPTVKNMLFTDGVIYMYMQLPELYGKEWTDDYHKAMLHNAENIAISRFDNKYWFNKIKKCYETNATGDSDSIVDIIDKCAEEYKNSVSKETGIVLKQLEVYKNLYTSIR